MSKLAFNSRTLYTINDDMYYGVTYNCCVIIQNR